MKNNGIIDLTGTNSTGMYTNYGVLENNKIINVAQNGVGLYGVNGTLSNNTNTGTINIGDNGIGIYGINVNPSSSSIYGNKKIEIEHSGKIISNGLNAAYGIIADNDLSLGMIKSDSKITINSGSLIDLSSVNAPSLGKAVGIYSNNSVLNISGDIKVGNNGVAVFAKNTDISAAGGTISLGDNSLGYYLSGGSMSSPAASNTTVNVTGKNVVIFNSDSVDISTENFTINSMPASSYILGNIKNSAFDHKNGSTVLDNNGILLNGKNSGILLDNPVVVNSTGTNVVAVALDGVTTKYPLGLLKQIEGTNRGTINLGNQSAGFYAINGAGVNNENIITVGDKSVALYVDSTGVSGTAKTYNSGVITVGERSQGIYSSNGASVENEVSGKITGIKNGATGILSSNTDLSYTSVISNNGIIDLSGDNSIGIYATNNGKQNIINNNEIKVGISSNSNNPSIGIYSDGINNSVINNAKIAVSDKSVGIYSKGGKIELNNGIINVGINATGVYADNNSIVVVAPNAAISLSSNEAVGVYGVNGSRITNNSANIAIGSGNYGFILNSGASFENNALLTLGSNEVLVYSDGGSTINNNNDINMAGSNNIAVYSVNGGAVTNTGNMNNSGGIGNIAVYNNGGSINNSGQLILGDSKIVSKNNTLLNDYAVGLYGENSVITNTGNIIAGKGSVGIYSKTDTGHGLVVTTNSGNIHLADGAVGLYAEGENTQIINASGAVITAAGHESIGMAAVGGALITNRGTINVTGSSSYGMYGDANSKIENFGTINVSGTDNIAILMANSSEIVNNTTGTINILSGSVNALGLTQSVSSKYEIPSIVNSGIINVSENFKVSGVEITIKVEPSTITVSTLAQDAGAKFISDSVKFYAPSFSVDEKNPLIVTPDFTQGTNAVTYKLKDVFNPTTPNGGPNLGTVPVVSKSLTWEAVPQLNNKGNIDIWMKKIPYDKFTSGLWYDDFGKNLDKKYGVDGISAEAVTIFNKLDYLDNERDFRHITASLAGNVYANINQREEDITRVFENSLDLLQNSTNNTKENVKVNVIVGEGSRKENTDGVVGYDYRTTGVLGLREVERTYRHTFGYSLGYLHSGFEFNDGNDSEEWVDTIQLGAHNKYKVNDWILKNDLTGRGSIHNVDRNIDWPVNGRSEINGTYETYSITSDNKLGKELKIGKNSSVTPYGGFRVMYVTRPSFEEEGLERLQVEGNDAWSVKPRAGVELKTEISLGKRTTWKAKGTLDLAYEYELADMNEREKARLVAIEDGYHNLAKPEEQKGQFKTRASIGLETEERYGVFLTGEYVAGEHDQEEYKAGISLKAVF